MSSCDPRSTVVVNADRTVVVCGPVLQGPTGAQGISGHRPSGSQGPLGTQGVQGDTGTQGVQGVVGELGERGRLGKDGITGESNEQGVQGTENTTQGIQGRSGTTGGPGSQGTTGPAGVQSTQGPQGIQGASGTQGSQGLQSILGIQGSQGSTGVQGTIGTQGNQGTQGTQGLQNATQGTVGIEGVSGSQGNQGLQPVPGDFNRGLVGPSNTTGIAVYDEGVLLTSNVESINFKGAAVSASEQNMLGQPAGNVNVSIISGSTVGFYKDNFIIGGTLAVYTGDLVGSFSDNPYQILFSGSAFSSSGDLEATTTAGLPAAQFFGAQNNQWTVRNSIDAAFIEFDLQYLDNQGNELPSIYKDYMEFKITVDRSSGTDFDFGGREMGSFSSNHVQNYKTTAIVEDLEPNDRIFVQMITGSVAGYNITDNITAFGYLRVTTLNHSF